MLNMQESLVVCHDNILVSYYNTFHIWSGQLSLLPSVGWKM